MYRIAVLGDYDSIYGFAALGLDTFPEEDPEEAAKKHAARGKANARNRRKRRSRARKGHSTVTLLARLRGLSTSQPRSTLM